MTFRKSLAIAALALLVTAAAVPALAQDRDIAERQIPVCTPPSEYVAYNIATGRWYCSTTKPAGVFTSLTLGSTAIARTGTEINLLTQGVAAGYRVARGETALDGAGGTTAATGLTSIVACAATMKISTSPGLSTQVLTYGTSGGTLTLYPWKPTGAGDVTLIASDGTQTVGWVCIGT
jgi:hypothetical protein